MATSIKLRRAEKITPRWPSRVDSRPRFEALLSAAEALLDAHSPSEISVQMIAERASVPVASVYHFFPSSDAAFFALAKTYLEEFKTHTARPLPDRAYATWQLASRERAARARGHFLAKRARMRLLLGPDVPRDVQTLDTEGNVEAGRLIADDMRLHYVISDFEGFEAIFANAIEISDTFWRISFCRFETITDEMFEESQRAVTAYLRTYLPELPPRRRPTATPATGRAQPLTQTKADRGAKPSKA